MTSTAPSRFSIGTLTISLCASLAIHAALAIGAAIYFVRSVGHIHLDGVTAAPVALDQTAPIFIPHNAMKFDEALGRLNGTGDSADDAPGETPLEARQAEQTQAFLSRDPVGAGAPHTDPSPSPVASEANSSAENSNASVEQREVPFGVAAIDGGARNVGEPVAHPESHEQKESKQSNSAGAAAPADPAPQAETESDPFAVQGSAQFRPGKTIAQLGRKHRLVAPRIGIAGMVEGQQLLNVKVVLQLTIDPTGNVRHAKIYKSSGSENIDQACRVAAYQWWFEPKKAFVEKSKEETFLFVISFS